MISNFCPINHFKHSLEYRQGAFLRMAVFGGQIDAVFVFDQNTPRRANICDNETTVSKLEKRLSFNPLPELKTYSSTLAKEMGCS